MNNISESIEIIQQLVVNKNLNIIDYDGKTPLQLATIIGNF